MVWRTVLCLLLLAPIQDPLSGDPATPRSLPSLSADDRELLSRLDPALAREVNSAAQEVEGWSDRIKALRRDLEEAQEDQTAVFGRVVQLAEVLSRMSPALRRLARVDDPLPRLRQADPTNRAQVARDAIDELARAAARIKTARKPSLYVLALLDGEPGKQFLRQSHRAGPVQFTLVDQPISRSLFSPDADLAIILSYPALGLKLRARGVYFRPRLGELPEPVLDPERMRIESEELTALIGRELVQLGEVIPELGLPIRAKDLQFRGFRGDQAGCVSGRLVISLGGPFGIAQADLLAVEVGVLVHSDGKIELDGPLRASFDRPLPLGTTGLVLDGGSLELRPRDRTETVRLTTHLAPAVGRKEGLSLEVTVRFGLPLREIRFDGRLMLARRESLGRVEGSLSPEKVLGRLLIPDPQGIARNEALKADLRFEMTREGILAEGAATLFGNIGGQVNLILPFTGEGLLMASENWRILGLTTPASVTVHFAPGFRDLELDADLQVEVDLDVLKVMASVSIHVVSQPRLGIEVTARALGVTARFRLERFGRLTVGMIRQQLKKKLTDLYDNLLHALADLEREGGELLAQAEQHLRGLVCGAFHRVGLARACTGCQESEARLVDLASGRKNLIAWGTLSRWKARRWLAEADNPPDHPILGLLEELGKELLDLFNAEHRQQRQVQAEREKQVDARLEPLVAAINGGEVNRTLERLLHSVCQSSNRCPKGEMLRGRTVTCLHLSCEYAVSAARKGERREMGPEPGDRDGMLGFVITSSGFQCRMDPTHPCRCLRRHGSDVQTGVVRFIGLLDPNRRPRAQIVLPELDHGSCLPARDYLFDILAELIERLLPEVEVEGRHLERNLAIRNENEEPARVWVQVLTRSPATGQWSWQPAGPEQPEQAYTMLLLPGESVDVQVNQVRLAGVAARIRSQLASRAGSSDSAEEVWLVDERDTLGRRCYRAGERGTFTIRLGP